MNEQKANIRYSPSPESTKLSACPVCGSTSINDFFQSKSNFLSKCKNCRLVFSSHVPTSKELLDFYSQYPRYTQTAEVVIRNYNNILDGLEKYRKNNRLIEIGCGEGFFLEQARKRNWEVYGTELSPEAIQICASKNLNVKSSVDQFGIKVEEAFDIVVSIEVIEHLPYPLKEAQLYSQLLRPGGALYVTTPNFNSISRRVLGEKWSIILYPEHLIYYSPQSLKYLLKKFGIQPVNIKTEGISPARFIYTYKKNKASTQAEASEYNYNEVDRNLRNQIEQNRLLKIAKAIVNYILRITASGDSMKALFEKPGK